MKVLLVSPLPPPNGGMATWTEQYLKDSENINEVYTVNTAFIGERALHKGGKIPLLPEVKRFFRIIMNYLSILRKKQVDVIHICSACSTTGIIRDALCVALSHKHHIVFHCHCSIQDQLKGKTAIRLGKYIFDSVDRIIVLNQASLSYVNKISGRKADKIPNAVDGSIIQPQSSIAEELKNIVYVGHVKQEKGIREIIDAAREEKDVVFHLIGPVSDEISKIQAPDNVVFYGRKEHAEAISLMRKADAFLFPSYTEGFSMVMLEAMASGLPIIATNVGSNAEMIETRGGIIIDPMSSEEIVRAIEKIRPQKVRSEMSAWNLNKVACAYKDVVVFQKIQEVYNEIRI